MDSLDKGNLPTIHRARKPRRHLLGLLFSGVGLSGKVNKYIKVYILSFLGKLLFFCKQLTVWARWSTENYYFARVLHYQTTDTRSSAL